jgi:hypothetical protein
VLAYNMKRMINIFGVKPLLQAIAARIRSPNPMHRCCTAVLVAHHKPSPPIRKSRFHTASVEPFRSFEGRLGSEALDLMIRLQTESCTCDLGPQPHGPAWALIFAHRESFKGRRSLFL